MKKIMLFLFLGLFSLLLVTACSDDGDDTDPDNWLAYSLDQFVPLETAADLIVHEDDDTLEYRDLFYFWSVAEDGYSARSNSSSSYDDLGWQDWVQGSYIPDWDSRVYFPQYFALDIGAYNTKYMDLGTVYVYRGIRSIICDTLSVVYELNAMATEQVTNYDSILEDAIPLTSFIPPHITVIDSVVFEAPPEEDGYVYSKTYTPEQFADGYWLVDSQRTIFPNEGANMSNSMKKFKFLKSIQFFGQWHNVENFENPAWADSTEADWIFTFPEDLSSYTGEIWE
jgi:hypothetical protein